MSRRIPDFEKAQAYALDRLEHELSPSLTYHCLEHTRDEVVPAGDRLAIIEKVGSEDRVLLLTGAYFHDLGYIRQRQDHELISIQFTEQTLPMFGYSETQIKVIVGIIQATHMPQSPTNLLEKIMADADLDHLGQDNFWKRNNDLRQELSHFGIRFTDEEWYTDQMHLMELHQYFTASERMLRDAAKQRHILEVKQRLLQLQ